MDKEKISLALLRKCGRKFYIWMDVKKTGKVVTLKTNYIHDVFSKCKF